MGQSINNQDKSTCQRSDGLVRQITILALLCAFAVQSRAETVVSFDVGASGAFSLTPTETAGIVNVGNWNNLTGSGTSDSFNNGVDSNGVATTIDLNITGADGVDWQGNSVPQSVGKRRALNARYRVREQSGCQHIRRSPGLIHGRFLGHRIRLIRRLLVHRRWSIGLGR